jgi:biopolymer transport protein ExbB
MKNHDKKLLCQTASFRRVVCAIFLMLGFHPVSALAWWDDAWAYRTKITLDATPAGANITESIGRAPVLVRLHAGNFTFADIKEDGSDLRFVAGDDKTPLKYHIEKIDALVDEVALIWVDVPAIAPGATTSVYVYYGNPEATAGADSKGTYDVDQTMVYHFAGPAAPADQSTYGNNSPSVAAYNPNSLVGSGLTLSGAAPVALVASPTLATAAGQAYTLTFWMRPAKTTTSGILYALAGGMTVGLDNGVMFVDVSGVRATASAPVVPESWTHVAVRADGKTIQLMVNGVVAGQANAAMAVTSGAGLIGGESGATRPNFVGDLDEFTIAKSARPVGFIQASAKSQGADGKLLKFDAAEQNGGGGGDGYFGILLSSLTVDGWAVIIILFVMFLVSVWVMWAKSAYISKISKADKAFMEDYRKAIAERPIHAGLPVQDSANGKTTSSHGNSPLARLFRIGQQELSDRLRDTSAPRGSHALAPQSVASIRSELDAGLIRENQRLNKWMVLLTIAISGGPFLGLLGTVVGVMITFAAIAAAGDVNINSIAPGIAAALLATVAGLAVAIPALFGYNYLLSRIDEISSDMQVFVDTLEKRIAETYRGAAAMGVAA